MILDQTYINYTLLIIFDKTISKNMYILDKIKEKYNNNKIVFMNNDLYFNMSKILNISLKYFLDNDYNYFTKISDYDIYYPNFLFELISKKSMFAYANYDCITNKTELNKQVEKHNFESYNDILENYNKIVSYMWSKEAIIKIGLYNEDISICEDMEYFLRTFKTLAIIDIMANNICNMLHFSDQDNFFVKEKEKEITSELKKQIIEIHKYLNTENNTNILIYYSNTYLNINSNRSFKFIQNLNKSYKKIFIALIDDIQYEEKYNLLIVPYNLKRCIYNILDSDKNKIITYFTDCNLCLEINEINKKIKSTLLYDLIEKPDDKSEKNKLSIDLSNYVIYSDSNFVKYFNKINLDKKYINVSNNKDFENLLYNYIGKKEENLLIKPNINYNYCFVISSYNNESNIEKNIYSIINQTYTNWRAIYINDNSSDKTDELFHSIINKNNVSDKFTYIKNNKRMYQMQNKYIAYQLVNDLEIVCILDGDDWLSNNDALKTLNYYYNNNDVNIICSNYNIYHNNIEHIQKTYHYYLEEEKNNIRNTNLWKLRHLKSGLGILFKSVSDTYFKYNNDWLDRCTDLAEMYSVCELANGNFLQIKDILYVYNKDNSLNYTNSYYNDGNSNKRKNIENHLKNLPKCKYSYPYTFIINMKKDTINKENMVKQMQIINNNTFEFIEAVDGTIDKDTQFLYDKYLHYLSENITKINISENIMININKIYKSKYNYKRQHITKKSLGLIQSIFNLLNIFVKNNNLEHILIFEDDIFSLKDLSKYFYINDVLLKNKDLIYLGCQNDKHLIYNETNDKDIYLNINNISYLIYGTYSIIISKKLAIYILSIGIDNILKLNLSWDLLLNLIRENNEFNFYLYFKQLFIPNVLKDGINGCRTNKFYEDRNIILDNYIINS